jgi:hypothetical protein
MLIRKINSICVFTFCLLSLAQIKFSRRLNEQTTAEKTVTTGRESWTKPWRVAGDRAGGVAHKAGRLAGNYFIE